MMKKWQGRIDSLDGAAGNRWHQVIRPFAADAGGAVVLAGFACDAGVARNEGRPGAARGPDALRHAMRNLPVHECTELRDAGDVECAGDRLEAAQEQFAARIGGILAAGAFPLGLGGGHEIAWGSFLGLAGHLESGAAPPRIGIINFDAHFDLRVAQRANSGTPFLQIAEECKQRGWPFNYLCLGISRYANTRALFERATQLGVSWRLDEDLSVKLLPDLRQTVGEFIARVDHVYLTICLDALPAAVAPGVSAPAARGIGLEIVEPLVDAILASDRVRVADIAELNPDHDIDGRTALVAARLAARIANGVYRPA